MPGPDLEVVGPFAQSLDRLEEGARRLLHRPADPRGPLQQVGPAHVADEDEVAREDAHRPVRRGRVGQDEAQMLGRMARCVEGVDSDASDLEGISIAEEDRARLPREPVAPVRASFVRQVEARSRPVGQLPGSRHEVGMDVRLRGVLDPETLALRRPHVRLDVPVRVHDQCLSRRLAADQVARLGQLLVVEALQDHEAAFLPALAA